MHESHRVYDNRQGHGRQRERSRGSPFGDDATRLRERAYSQRLDIIRYAACLVLFLLL